jgi:hypothetical protein
MKTVVKTLIIIIMIICLIATYWIIARYTTLIQDDILKKNQWGNVNPIATLVTGIISLIILTISLKYYDAIFQILKLLKTIKIGFFASLFFILIATMFWSDSWTDNTSDVLDSRELGDGIWKLGHPLTFLIIDLPIYLRHKVDILQNYWSDLWAYPSVLLLFVIQFSIYIHGLRIVFNLKKITNYKRLSDLQQAEHISSDKFCEASNIPIYDSENEKRMTKTELILYQTQASDITIDEVK